MKIMWKRVCGLCGAMLIYFSGFSQQLITIQGNIKDERSNPVRYASVYLLNSNYFAVSDTSGGFTIKNIHEGNYTLIVSGVGYATISKDLQITKGNETSFNLQLPTASKQLDFHFVFELPDGWPEGTQSARNAIARLVRR